MHIPRLAILILLLTTHALSSLGLAYSMVMCLGPDGHLAIELPDHKPGCEHGCPNEPSSSSETISDTCAADHHCTDIGLTQQLTHRLATSRKLSAPATTLSAGRPPSAKLESVPGSRITPADFDSRGSPSLPSAIRTVVLRL